MSKDLLSILSDRQSYHRYANYVKDHTLSKEEGIIIKDLGEYFETHSDFDWMEFKDWFKLIKHPMYSMEKLQVFEVLFNQMEGYLPSVIADDIINQYIKQDFCTRISDITLRGTDGEDVNLDDVFDLLSDYNHETDRATRLEDFICTESIAEIIERQQTEGMDWPIQFLNRSIGLLSIGKLICLGARPNAGKTTFLGNCAVHFLPQLEEGKTVLWFNNEEEEGSVKKRILQCGINWLGRDIDADPIGAVKAFEDKYGDFSRIKVINAVTFDKRMVEEMCKVYKPGIIIIDQLRKVRGEEKRTSNEVERLELLYQWAREMAKVYAPLITVHQLKGEAEGVPYPTMNMLYGSSTAVQGEVDALLMLGKSMEDANPDTRYLSIVKNKEAFGPDVEVGLSEGKDELILIPHLAKFEE